MPLGHLADAKEYSQATHQLPWPPNAKGERNYVRILHDMNEFMGNPASPLLFTAKENIPIIKSFLKTFIDHQGDDEDNVDRYRVYPLHQLFYDIKEEAVKMSVEGVSFKSIHIAEEHLKRDDYTYLTNTACAVSGVLRL